MPDPDVTTVVAVLSSQMGELKHAIEGTIKDHGRRISALEEKEIRRQERESTEARIRGEAEERHDQEHDRKLGRLQLSVSRIGLWVAIVTALALIAGTVIGIVQAVS